MNTADPTPVLCVSAESLKDLGPIEGFEPDPHGDALRALLGLEPGPKFLPRSEVETDPTWRQLIPYCVLWRGPEVLCYRRGPIGSEDRLHGRYSIGIGGHVEERDQAPLKPMGWSLTIAQAARREIAEETGITRTDDFRFIGLVATDDEVGRFHLGCVYFVQVADEPPSFSADLHIPAFRKPERIDREVQEPWSLAVLDWWIDGRITSPARS